MESQPGTAVRNYFRVGAILRRYYPLLLSSSSFFCFNCSFQVGDLDLDPVEEMADRTPGSNHLFKRRVKPLSAFCEAFQYHQQILRARLPNSLDCNVQFVRVDALFKPGEISSAYWRAPPLASSSFGGPSC